MEFAVLTDCGPRRSVNEDGYCIRRGEIWNLFAVADGMGGHAAGELASARALEVLSSRLSESIVDDRVSASVLERCIQHANTKVHMLSLECEEYSGMGTTLTSLLLSSRGEGILGHVGDSRAYLLREGELDQISRDHSPVGELFHNGQITEAEAKAHPRRNLLSRALGTSPTLEVDVSRFRVLSGDMFLLCTDGLSGTLFNDTIKEIMVNALDLEKANQELVETALKRGGDDNITSLLIRME